MDKILDKYLRILNRYYFDIFKIFFNSMWIEEMLKKEKSFLVLAPMADMTDSPFCQIIKEIGGCDVVFREMVSSEAVVRDNEKTLKMAEFVDDERPIVQQIFGADPITMARAAAVIMEKTNPDGIDINMGCPVYKITNNFSGAALMRNLELAGKIVKEVKSAIGDTPLSVKTRLGWSDSDDFKIFLPVLEKAGVDLISVHGRTKSQAYSGKSDWERIGEAKKIVSVPVLANGDIHEPEQVEEALGVTGCDGVLIGRGALGNPWFFKLCAKVLRLNGGSARAAEKASTNIRTTKNVLTTISLDERIRVVLEHARLHCEFYGERGVVTFRKHLAWYFKSNKVGFNILGIKEFRARLVRVSSIGELEEILSELQERYKV